MSDINKICLFVSHFSAGRSVLTLDKTDEIKENSPVSIRAIAKKHELKQVFLVDTRMSGFIEAYKNLNDITQLCYGIKLMVCEDCLKKDEESRLTESKVIIFAKNSAGYKDLIKIYSDSWLSGFYYYNRSDWQTIQKLWTDNLLLCIPFYDSFLHLNLLEYKKCCVPNFGKIKPLFFVESHELPYDFLIEKAARQYCKVNKFEIKDTHTVYYYKNSDIFNYYVFRCIANRTTITAPELNSFNSDRFSFESING